MKRLNKPRSLNRAIASFYKMNNDYREINFCILLAIAWIVITLATGIYIETL